MSVDVRLIDMGTNNVDLTADVKCMSCDWIGTRILLLPHIKAHHDDNVYKIRRMNWVLPIRMLDLMEVQQGYTHFIEDNKGSVYIVRIKYQSHLKLTVSIYNIVEEEEPMCGCVILPINADGLPSGYHLKYVKDFFLITPVTTNTNENFNGFDLVDLRYLSRVTVEPLNYDLPTTSAPTPTKVWGDVIVPLYIEIGPLSRFRT